MTQTIPGPEATVDPLMARQLELERESIESGIANFRNRNARLEAKGLTAQTDYGKRLVAAKVEALSNAIRQFIADAKAKPGKRASAVVYLELVEPEVVALVTLRRVLDGIAQRRTMQYVAMSVAGSVEDECRFRSFEDQKEDLFTKVNNNFDKSPWAYSSARRRSVLAHAANKFNVMWGQWARSEKLHLGMALLTLLIESCGLVEPQPVQRGVKDMAYYLAPTAELQEWIIGFKSEMELLRPHFMPCVVPPRPWTSPFSGGYHGPRANHYLTLVKSRSKGYLKELAHRQMPEVYEAVNALQETAWRINSGMLTVVREIWEAGLEVKGLPSRNDAPLPGKPADIDSNPKALAKWKREAGDVYRSNVRAGSKRIQAAKIIYVAEKFAAETAIYFPMQLDFRGRMYAIPLFLNPQGNDLAKSLLTFATGKPLGKSGVFWLGVHLANTYGYDKCSLQERHDWAVANSEKIEASAIQKDFDSTQGYSIEHHQRYQLFFQLTRMTRDKGALAKDDRLDALAMAVAYWSKALAVETEKVVQAKRDEMLKAELERYMAHAIGYRPPGRMYATTGHER